ncbi:MAG: hypothetical protein LBC76_07545 [Treponema sp.]|jgi:hypothetical protein|nr:hypothetical protein [Treponema sp.]
MKKLFLTLTIISFLTLSCVDKKPVLISNRSATQTINFSLFTGSYTKDYSVIPLGQQVVNIPDSYNHKMVSYQSSPVIDCVDLVQDGDVYYFNEIKPFPASIYNALGKDVVLSGNGAISTDPLTINAGETIETKNIKSRTPEFNAHTTDGHTVKVDINFNGTRYIISLH